MKCHVALVFALSLLGLQMLLTFVISPSPRPAPAQHESPLTALITVEALHSSQPTRSEEAPENSRGQGHGTAPFDVTRREGGKRGIGSENLSAKAQPERIETLTGTERRHGATAQVSRPQPAGPVAVAQVPAPTSGNVAAGATVKAIASAYSSAAAAPFQIGDANDPCSGRRVYVYQKLPGVFERILNDCPQMCPGRVDHICPNILRDGLGHNFRHQDFNDSYGNSTYSYAPWLPTEQHMLGLLFNTRFKSYECLTSDWEDANAFYIPALFGLLNLCVQDDLLERAADELETYLKIQPAFVRSGGSDHFTVWGQQIWTFMKSAPGEGWGTYVVHRPAWKELIIVSVERIEWEPRIQSIPYPSAFHPADVVELQEWIQHVEHHPRPTLISLAAGARYDRLRTAAISACTNRTDVCLFVDCQKDCPDNWCFDDRGFCADPRLLSTLLLSSTFCLQPPGDSKIRRSAMDSLIAGCIPVFFAKESFHIQYKWNLPWNRSEISILFDRVAVLKGELDFIVELQKIPEHKIQSMRGKILETIPGLLFRDHTRVTGRALFRDALDLAIQGLVQDVVQTRRGIA